MDLKVGEKAPNFNLKNQKGETVSLTDFLGETVILYFYPKDLTPGCTTQACDFRDALPQLKKFKVKVLGISKDSVESHAKFVAKESLNFSLLSDEDGEACKLYNVWKEKNNYGKKSMGIVRSTFVIDPTGILTHVMMNVKATGHVARVLQMLSQT